MDGLAMPIPGKSELAPLGPEATQIALAHSEIELLLGWPTAIVTLRREGAVLYGEGDLLHLGELLLDRDHRVRRTGHTVGNDIELALTAQGTTERVLLSLGGRASVGPYSIVRLHSRDIDERAIFLRVRRSADTPAPALPANHSHPLDVERPEQVVALAREQELLDADEALWLEPRAFAEFLKLFEGPTKRVEQMVREAGATPFVRSGESVVTECGYVSRAEHGAGVAVGLITMSLEPTGRIAIVRGWEKEVPGRLRRQRKQG